MSILLFGAGAVAFIAGAVMIGFGIPVNEFSFGNTLIISGSTAVMGGLIVVGLGAAVSHLQRIADAQLTRTPVRSSRPSNAFETTGTARPAAVPGRIPFPPRQKPEARLDQDLHEPTPVVPMAEAPAAMPGKEPTMENVAPSLPNPDEPSVTVEEEVSLSPRNTTVTAVSVEFDEPVLPPASGSAFKFDSTELDETRSELPKRDAGRPMQPPVDAPPTRSAQTTYFDAMWPAESKPAASKPVEAKAYEPKISEPKWDNKLQASEDLSKPPVDQHVEPHVPHDEPRTVAILKSGVVDGMGYTLYVDGSIEAELPQGTLRFASINELRSHLEKT